MLKGSYKVNSTLRRKPLHILVFEIGLFLIPYDAMHVMPSTYAPLSVYPFFISFFIGMIKKKWKVRLNKNGKKLLIAYVYMILISAITSQIYVSTYKYYLSFCLTFTIGIITYFSVTNALGYYKEKYTQENAFEIIMDVICKAYYIPLL